MADFTQDMAAGYGFEGGSVAVGRPFVDPAAPDDAVEVRIPLGMLNRHGLIAGATGTGKTKTLQLLAEQISAAGCPVFAADMKGDLAGLGAAGEANDKVAERAAQLAHPWAPAAAPVELLSLTGGDGVPLRASVASFGPVLLSKVLGLNETQESSLALVFRFCDEKGLLLLELEDLRAALAYLVSAQGKTELEGLGGLSKATVGVLQRKVSELESEGGDVFFGEPELDVTDLLRTTPDGRGVVSVLGLTDVAQRPMVFSTFLHVGPGRAVRGAAGGGRPREAVARLLLRRGAPPLRRRRQGLPRGRHAHGAPHPLEGRRGVLRDAAPHGPAR